MKDFFAIIMQSQALSSSGEQFLLLGLVAVISTSLTKWHGTIAGRTQQEEARKTQEKMVATLQLIATESTQNLKMCTENLKMCAALMERLEIMAMEDVKRNGSIDRLDLKLNTLDGALGRIEKKMDDAYRLISEKC